MNKIFRTLGAATIAASPLVVAISCGETKAESFDESFGTLTVDGNTLTFNGFINEEFILPLDEDMIFVEYWESMEAYANVMGEKINALEDKNKITEIKMNGRFWDIDGVMHAVKGSVVIDTILEADVGIANNLEEFIELIPGSRGITGAPAVFMGVLSSLVAEQ